jgi:hypothetical protein
VYFSSCWCRLSLSVGCVPVYGAFIFPSSLPGGSLFGGIGVGVLLETCDSSDSGADTSVMCIRISDIR